jgi:hypothetical protein
VLSASFAWTMLAAGLQQQALPTYRHDDAPVVHAAPIRGSIRVDGVLDESGWRRATPVDVFTQMDPREGAPGSERTEVRVLVAGDALYIGARLYDAEPSRIVGRLGRRDAPLGESDAFQVLLDSYHDHLTAFGFGITPAGAIRDVVIGADGEEDETWDGVWDGAATVDSLGWSAELRIPLSQLRYRRTTTAWGIQLVRTIVRKQETSVLAFTPKAEQAGINRYGHLIELGDLAVQERLQLLPHTVLRGERVPVEAGDPFASPTEAYLGAGLELRYRVTGGMALNATANPDFGQVEADPAVVNLTAYETRYDEKRPFFIEGADFFRFGRLRAGNAATAPEYFFSRRIGREPTLEPDYDYVDIPEVTTILGAAKLTGKSGGWSVGLLDAVTAREEARYFGDDSVVGTMPVEPRTNYFAGRVVRELRAGSTAFGAFATSVRRDLATSDLEEQLRSSATAFGVDANHAWGNRTWALDGSLAASVIRGSADAINAVQRSSARYYQRPDATHLDYDPTRTSLSGYAGQLSLAKLAGRHWRWSAAYQAVSPGLEVNDLGFQRDADRRVLSGQVQYLQQQPTRLVRRWQVSASADQTWNFGGNELERGVSLYFFTQLHNYWTAYGTGGRGFPALDDRLTRSGPLARDPGDWYLDLNVTTDDRRPVFAWGNAYVWRDGGGSWTASGNASLSIKPAPGLKLRVGPYVEVARYEAQAVTRVSDTLATATYGRRYVFGTLEQVTTSVSTRVDWTFSPRLSLQLYGQLFVGSGEYHSFKEFAAPRTYDFTRYGVDSGWVALNPDGQYTVDPDGVGPAAPFTFSDPNFNDRSLRGTAVLRWEYRPGSTVYLAWQHRRSDSAPVGDFSMGRDVRALFAADATNVLVLKATYWIGL